MLAGTMLAGTMLAGLGGAGVTRTRDAVALASALALVSAAPLVGRPAAFAQGVAPDGGTVGAPAPAPAPIGVPGGVPGGGEVEPRPGPPAAPAPSLGGAPAPNVDVGPEIADPDADPDLGDPIGGGLGAGSGDAVAVPDIGVAGEPIGGAEDLDPGDSPFARGLDTDPLGLDPGADLGRLDPLFERDAERRGRRPRPTLGRVSERGPGGLTLAFGVGLTLRAEDNPQLRAESKDGETVLVTELSFGVLSQTRVQRLALDIDADLAASSDPDEGDDTLALENPRLGFAYEREGARARVGAALRYRRVDLDEARLLDLDTLIDDLPQEDDLVISGGTRSDLDAEIEIVTGLGRPLGFELELRAEQRGYADAGDPDLTDRDIYEAEGALRLDATPLLTTRLTFGLSDLDDASGEERRTRALGVSAVYAATARTTLTAVLGGSRVEALRGIDLDDDGTDDELRASETSGAVGSLGLVFDMPSGTIAAEIESEIEEGGRRDTLRVARAFEPLAGVDLSASVGVSREEGEDTELVADIAYVQELARGALRASLERRAGTSADGNDITATTASLGLLQEISRVSRVTLDLDFAQVASASEGDVDESQSELRLAYIRALTPDWSLATGYELTRRTEGSDDATSNAVFVTLGRGFVIRP